MCDAARQFRFRHVRRRQDEHVPRGVAGEQGKGATARYSAIDRSASGDEARVAVSAWGPVPNPNRPMANGQWRARDAILSLTRPRTGDPVTSREQRPAALVLDGTVMRLPQATAPAPLLYAYTLVSV